MNDLKTILLHLDASSNITQRLQLARQLAQAHGAQIEVLYSVLPTVLHPYAFAGDGQAAVAVMQAEAEERGRARSAFDQVQSGGGVSMTWHEIPDPPLQTPVQLLVQQAWSADLLLLAQHDPAAEGYSGVPSDFATMVLLASGKPCLVMPYIGPRATCGENVLIAWKPTPESARAVSAALPILQRARQVDVAVWDETGADAGAPPAVETFLRRHGVKANVHHGGRATRELGELLLSRAAELQSDLLVMGCYGHGRAREWVLGGVTLTVMHSMTVPVLMVH